MGIFFLLIGRALVAFLTRFNIPSFLNASKFHGDESVNESVALAQKHRTNDNVAFYPRNFTESWYIKRKSTQHDDKKYGEWKTIKSSKFNDSGELNEYTQ